MKESVYIVCEVVAKHYKIFAKNEKEALQALSKMSKDNKARCLDQEVIDYLDVIG